MAVKTLIEKYPRLLIVLGSKNPLYCLISVIPLALIFVSTLIGSEELGFARSLLAFMFGLFYWSFFEYATHRWAYHTHFRSRSMRSFFETFHLYHHRNLFDKRVLNAGPLMVIPMTLVLLAPVYLAVLFLGLNPALTSWVGLGLLSYYYFYEWVHFGIHYKSFQSGYMASIQKYHLYHHAHAWKKNFGNTITLWDRLLGTYDGRYRSYTISEEMEATFVANQIYHGRPPAAHKEVSRIP